MALFFRKVLSGVAVFASLGIALVVVGVPGAVRADDGSTEIVRNGSADDEVFLELIEEAWVDTDTASVKLAADLAVEAGQFGAARADLEGLLAGFVEQVDWRIVDFNKLRDDAGFERWRVVAEARVPAAVVAALPDQAKQASAPGRALSVAAVDYTPTLAERERANRDLRARIYARVAAEIQALNAAFPDRVFRMRAIQLAPMAVPRPRGAMMRADVAQTAGAPQAPVGVSAAEKAIVAARVQIAAEAAQ